MKSFLAAISLLIICAANSAHANSENLLEVRKKEVGYTLYEVSLPGGKKPGAIYRITASKEIGGCSSIQYALNEAVSPEKSMARDFEAKFIITTSGFSPANGCSEPDEIASQSFDVVIEKYYLHLVVPSDVDVTVEKLK